MGGGKGLGKGLDRLREELSPSLRSVDDAERRMFGGRRVIPRRAGVFPNPPEPGGVARRSASCDD